MGQNGTPDGRRCATSQIGNGPEGGTKWPALGHGGQEGQRRLRLCPRSLFQRRRAGAPENHGRDVNSLLSRGECHAAALCFQGNRVLLPAGFPGASRIPGDFIKAASPVAKLVVPAFAGNSTSPMLKCNRPARASSYPRRGRQVAGRNWSVYDGRILVADRGPRPWTPAVINAKPQSWVPAASHQ